LVLGEYLRRLEALSGELSEDLLRLAEEVDDGSSKEFVMKVTKLISINHSLVTLQLLGFRMHTKENERAIDEEINEISEYVSQILDVHLREAENLEKVL
jgi:Asp-tRNA(Asn)/Glu-tRNA(Gln) amidotransferase C subunit